MTNHDEAGTWVWVDRDWVRRSGHKAIPSKMFFKAKLDENNQIRVLSQEKYRETEAMKTETIDFLKKIMSFNDMVTTLIEVLDSQA